MMMTTCPIVPIPVRQEKLHITVVRMPIRRSAPLTESMAVGKAVPASGWKDSATIAMLMTMTKAMKVAMEEMMAGMTAMEVVERMAAGVVAATMIATTVVIR